MRGRWHGLRIAPHLAPGGAFTGKGHRRHASSGAPFLVRFSPISPPLRHLPNALVRPLAVFARGLPELVGALIPSRACQSHASTSTPLSPAPTTPTAPIPVRSSAAPTRAGGGRSRCAHLNS